MKPVHNTGNADDDSATLSGVGLSVSGVVYGICPPNSSTTKTHRWSGGGSHRVPCKPTKLDQPSHTCCPRVGINRNQASDHSRKAWSEPKPFCHTSKVSWKGSCFFFILRKQTVLQMLVFLTTSQHNVRWAHVSLRCLKFLFALCCCRVHLHRRAQSPLVLWHSAVFGQRAIMEKTTWRSDRQKFNED